MRKFFKRATYLLGGVIVLAVLLVGAIYLISAWRYNRTYAIDAKPISVSTSDTSVVTRGQHIAATRGCADCHGTDFGGRTFIDDPMMGRISGANLTFGEGGIGASYTDADWVRALRHGVDPQGKPLAFMPSDEYMHLSDGDLGALITYLKQLPPVDRMVPAPEPGPMARLLTALASGGLPTIAAEKIDHAAAKSPKAAPPAGPTAEYGEYLAPTCTGCHGKNFSGGPIPGGPPNWPEAANLTPHVEDGLGAWSEADFVRALRRKRRPDGSEISEVMPAALGQMTDVELKALWTYLQTLQPQASVH